MQAMEFAKGRQAALALVFVADAPGRFAQEFREAKAALLAWNGKHGDACDMVMFTVTAPPEVRDEVRQFLDRVYHEEMELAPLLQRIKVEVSILDSRGKPACQYSMGTAPPPPAQQAKSWWKFW